MMKPADALLFIFETLSLDINNFTETQVIIVLRKLKETARKLQLLYTKYPQYLFKDKDLDLESNLNSFLIHSLDRWNDIYKESLEGLL